jgi:putative spermidine/putrescine transport system permease protein
MRSRREFDPIGFGLTLGLILVGLFMAAPLIFVIVNSFNAASGSGFPPEEFSTYWYRNALFEIGPMSPAPQFRKGLKNSLITAAGATVLSLVMGASAARAFVRYRFPGKELVRSFFSAPLIVPSVVFGMALFLLYIRLGVYGSLYSLIIAHAILGLPFAITVLSSTLLGIDPATEEAARDLGATPLKTFVLVTLPQMRVGLIVATLYAFITSFDQVTVSIFLTRPRNNTLPIEMLNYLETHQNPTLAAVSSMLIAFSILLVITAGLLLRAEDYRRLLERQ